MIKEWTEEEIQLLREKYPTTYTSDLELVFGVAKRTVINKAKSLGIEKDPNYKALPKEEVSRRISLGIKNSPCTAMINTRFKKGCTPSPGCFKKGEKPIDRIGPEREKERLRKSAESRKETYRKEHARYIFGLPQKTKLIVHRQSRSKVMNRYYLKKMGYIIDDKQGIAYWNSNTTRALITEKNHRYYKFMEYGTETAK